MGLLKPPQSFCLKHSPLKPNQGMYKTSKGPTYARYSPFLSTAGLTMVPPKLRPSVNPKPSPLNLTHPYTLKPKPPTRSNTFMQRTQQAEGSTSSRLWTPRTFSISAFRSFCVVEGVHKIPRVGTLSVIIMQGSKLAAPALQMVLRTSARHKHVTLHGHFFWISKTVLLRRRRRRRLLLLLR